MADTNLVLSETATNRVLRALVAEEWGRVRGRTVSPEESAGWDDTLVFDEDGLGTDSLGVLDLASRVNQYFNLSDIGIEDYLLMKRTFADWTEIIQAAFTHGVKRLSFQTSGSTGTPKVCTHSVVHLHDEMDAFGKVFPKIGRVISLVPPHHIYGFLFSVLYPERHNVNFIDGRLKSPGQLKDMAGPADLIVGTPILLRYLERSLGELPAMPVYLTSTAPMPQDQAAGIRDNGRRNLFEIYGSSETSGLGVRSGADADYSVLSHLDITERDGERVFVRKDPETGNAGFPPPDVLEWSSERTFRPVRRRDGAVQVGGINVFPDHVRSILEEHEGVSECGIRLTSGAGTDAAVRLKAFVVHDESTETDALEKSLRDFAKSRLKDAERPVHYTFGAELPRNEMGKLSDW